MRRLAPSRVEDQTVRAMSALGGEGTLGDIVVLAALARQDVEAVLDHLIASGRAQVRVCESGEVVYRMERDTARSGVHRSEAGTSGERSGPATAWPEPRKRPAPPTPVIPFDRKTLRLIRARDGVISLAELVEHTGLPLEEAAEEMERLARWYGGEAHPSLDGHVVHAFPELMTSAHGRFHIREPRPAWVRFEDPMRSRTPGDRPTTVGLVVRAAGLAAAVAVPVSVASVLGATTPWALLAVAAAAGAGVVTAGRSLLRGLRNHRVFRFRQRGALRRYALGHIFETALAGKGIVSLSSTVTYLESRAGGRKILRSLVETVLRDLATEFDALVTRDGEHLFFGFRNVKRQFLASELVRRRLGLGRTAHGRTVFDSGDSRRAATDRDLEMFDRELAGSGHSIPMARVRA